MTELLGSMGIIGDQYGIDLPEIQPDPNLLNEERKTAKFTRTAEFKKQKEYLEERIVFYQTMLPNGMEIGLDVVPSIEDWRVANRIIGEFKAFLNIYESAKEAVEDSNG